MLAKSTRCSSSVIVVSLRLVISRKEAEKKKGQYTEEMVVLDAAGVAVLGTSDGGALVFTTEEELSGAGEGYSQVKHDLPKA